MVQVTHSLVPILPLGEKWSVKYGVNGNLITKVNSAADDREEDEDLTESISSSSAYEGDSSRDHIPISGHSESNESLESSISQNQKKLSDSPKNNTIYLGGSNRKPLSSTPPSSPIPISYVMNSTPETSTHGLYRRVSRLASLKTKKK